jgi:hypothetical protein
VIPIVDSAIFAVIEWKENVKNPQVVSILIDYLDLRARKDKYMINTLSLFIQREL